MKAKTILPVKITRPGVSNIYLRKRLFKQLDTERKNKGIYVCGPPGAGKTTLINSWIESLKLTCLWYRVDEGDADLSTIFHYLSLAEKRLNPKKKKPLPNLTPEYKLGINTFARRYFEELFSRIKPPSPPFRKGNAPVKSLPRTRFGGASRLSVAAGFSLRFVLVLDNFQEASSEKFHEIVNIALNEVPEGCNIIIISRTAPPSAFSRSIANKDIKTVGWDDLQLTEDETKGIVRLLGYKESVCSTLNTQFCKCRGWIAGLLLLLERAEKNMIEKEGANKIIGESSFNYFMSEIFEKLDDRTKDFLLKTSFLPNMTLPMAINLSENEKGGEILIELNKRHFFTEKSGGAAADTYHYHPLFREFLQSSAGKSFTKEHINELRIKAGYLLLDTGDVENAAESFKEAGYYKGLNRVITKHAPELIKEGRLQILESWIKCIPEGVIENMPWSLYYLGFCRLPINPADARGYLSHAYKVFKGENDRAGIFLSWSAVVDTFLFEWKDFKPLDFWIEEFEELVAAPFTGALSSRRLKPAATDKDLEGVQNSVAAPPKQVRGRLFTGAFPSNNLEGSRSLQAAFPSKDIEEKVTVSMFGALMFRQPQNPEISQWEEKAKGVMQNTQNNTLKISVGNNLILYYLWMGHIPKAGAVVHILSSEFKASDITSLQQLMLHRTKALYSWYTNSHKTALEIVEEGLKTADKTGIHILDTMFLGQGIYNSVPFGEIERAEGYLKRIESVLNSRQSYGFSYYHQQVALVALHKGDFPSAIEHIETGLKLEEGVSAFFTKSPYRYLLSYILLEVQKYSAAKKHIDTMYKDNIAVKSFLYKYCCFLLEALMALKEGDEKGFLSNLSKTIEIGKAQGIIFYPYMLPSTLSSLCAKAIENELEVEWIKNVIRTYNLLPPQPLLEKGGWGDFIENWPYPIKIYTLGRFEILKDEHPIEFGRKAQKRPLDLLKAIIAFGSKDIAEEELADALYPDSEGDTAHSALKMTLSRLRQLVDSHPTGGGCIIYREGKITLDNRYCYVDVWAFENLLKPLTPPSPHRGEGTPIASSPHRGEEKGEGDIKSLEKAINLYKGDFLAGDKEESWTIKYREQLREKFIKCIERLGRHYEDRGEFKKAIGFYNKGIEADELVEKFYQRLMLCYKKMGDKNEALRVYKRCKTILSSSFGSEPSYETEEVYRSLMG